MGSVALLLPAHVEHGSSNAYANYKCRCAPCRRAQGVRAREYRDRNRDRFREQRRTEYATDPERFKRANKAMTSRRKAILGRFKTLKGCARCGYSANPLALEFHHRDPAEKEFNVSEKVSRSWQAVKTEVRKCEVLCSNCHRIEEGSKWET